MICGRVDFDLAIGRHPKIFLALLLKVSYSWKQNSKFSFEHKTEQKYFCIFALASKMGQIKKIMAHYHANQWLCVI